MSLLTRAGDLVYTFRFLKMLVTKFEDTDAFKNGIIDENGKRIKSKFISTSSEKASYTPFHKLVFNIKKILAKAPGGSSKLASYAAALFLLKEEYNLTDNQMDKILQTSEIDVLDLIEEQHEWYLLQDNQLSPGVYRVRNEKVINDTWDEIVFPKDKIRVHEDSFPVGEIFGINIYEAEHINTGKNLYFTLGEIYK